MMLLDEYKHNDIYEIFYEFNDINETKNNSLK